jgi:hypothetical protein
MIEVTGHGVRPASRNTTFKGVQILSSSSGSLPGTLQVSRSLGSFEEMTSVFATEKYKQKAHRTLFRRVFFLQEVLCAA